MQILDFITNKIINISKGLIWVILLVIMVALIMSALLCVLLLMGALGIVAIILKITTTASEFMLSWIIALLKKFADIAKYLLIDTLQDLDPVDTHTK